MSVKNNSELLNNMVNTEVNRLINNEKDMKKQKDMLSYLKENRICMSHLDIIHKNYIGCPIIETFKKEFKLK